MAAFARCSLIVMNSIFLVGGIVLFAFGIWMAVDDDYLIKFGTLLKVDTDNVVFSGIKLLLEDVQQAAFILMGCGLGIFIISILGFCSAIKQTVCSLILYCAIVAVLIMVQEGIAVFVIFNKQQVNEAAGKKTVQILSVQYEKTFDKSNNVSVFLDLYQIQNQCCGINEPRDYDQFTKWRDSFNETLTDKSIVPKTCCGQENTNKAYLILEKNGSCPNGGVKQDGCFKPVIEKILSFDSYIIAAAVTVGFIEIFGIALALYIAFSVHKDPNYKEMK